VRASAKANLIVDVTALIRDSSIVAATTTTTAATTTTTTVATATTVVATTTTTTTVPGASDIGDVTSADLVAGTSFRPAISGNGRLVAFVGIGAVFVPSDAAADLARDGQGGLYVLDRNALKIRRYAKPTGGTGFTVIRNTPTMTSDGRFVAFNAIFTNNSEGLQVRVVNLATGVVTTVSNPAIGTASEDVADISDDGNLVVFKQLDVTCTDGVRTSAIVLHDIAAGTDRCIDTPTANLTAFNPNISGNGRYVVFNVANSTTSTYDIIRYDRTTGVAEPVSKNTNGTAITDATISSGSAVSGDGDRVVFSTIRPRVGPNSNVNQVFIRHITAARTYTFGATDTIKDPSGASIARNSPFVAFGAGDSRVIEDPYFPDGEIQAFWQNSCPQPDGTYGTAQRVLSSLGSGGRTIAPVLSDDAQTIAVDDSGAQRILIKDRTATPPTCNFGGTTTTTTTTVAPTTTIRPIASGVRLVSVPDGYALSGLVKGSVFIPPKGGLMIDRATPLTPVQLRKLVDPVPHSDEPNFNVPQPNGDVIAGPSSPTGSEVNPAGLTGFAVYLGGRKASVARRAFGVDRSYGEVLPNGQVFAPPLLSSLQDPRTYFDRVDAELAKLTVPSPLPVSVLPLWVDLRSPCHKDDNRPPVASTEVLAQDTVESLIPSWYPYLTPNPIIDPSPTAPGTTTSSTTVPSNTPRLPYSQLDGVGRTALLDLAYARGLSSGRRASLVAETIFGLPKTQAIYLDVEDVNKDVPAGLVTAAAPARAGFEAVPSIAVPALNRTSDCIPPAITFTLGYMAGLAQFGYRGALYTGGAFYQKLQTVNFFDALLIAGSVGITRQLKTPAGLWLANVPPSGYEQIQFTWPVGNFTPPRSRVYNDSTYTFAGWDLTNFGGQTGAVRFTDHSGNQFRFKQKLQRNGVDLGKENNLDCFAVLDPLFIGPPIDVRRRFVNDQPSTGNRSSYQCKTLLKGYGQ
jgi:Tol biopolymer transport system component